MQRCSVFLLIGLYLAIAHCAFLTLKEEPTVYESEWAVEIDESADVYVLERHGYEVVGQVADLENVYLVRHKETYARYARTRSPQLTPALDVTARLSAHPAVKWATQQYQMKVVKRAFTDPLFNQQWHLVNTGQFNGSAGADVNIQGAWDLGYSGRGVRIAFVDDGFQTTHPDLVQNYRADSSFNFGRPQSSSPDPNVASDFHGTSCAGVAMASNNSVCGVGAAFLAEGAGIRLLGNGQGFTDATGASALTYRNQLNDIYSNSWGPGDNGITVGGPGPAMKAALKDGVTNGRGGLGSIYVWAAGNGGDVNDNCNYDGYSVARETIAVGAIGNNGKQSYYSEPCAAMLVTAPSSSANTAAGIRTTDLVGGNGYDASSCNPSFGGTSSACPLVAGIIALMLEANPRLTWRDVPVILATTATKTDPQDSDWTNNGAGLHVNHKYGFGRVDATAAVKAAKNHVLLSPELTRNTGAITVGQSIPDNSPTGVTSSVAVTDNFIVEKVVVTVNINHQTSGDLKVVLTSPSGTQSVLSEPHAFIPALTALNRQNQNTAFIARAALFGGAVTFTGVTGTIVPSNPTNACTQPTNCAALSGAIAYVLRGTCDFVVKAALVQGCGATAMVVGSVDPNDEDVPFPMGGTDPTITIPCISVAYATDQALRKSGTATVALTQYSQNSYNGGWDFSTTRSMGESSQGTWTVQVTDGLPGGTGTWNSYTLNIYGSNSRDSFNPSSNAAKNSCLGFVLSIVVVLMMF